MPERPVVVERRKEVYVEDDTPEIRQRRQVVRNLDAERRVAISKIVQLVWLLFGLLDMLLLFRFALKLFSANPNNAFARFIYDLSRVFMVPFAEILPTITSGSVVLELSILVAVVVYSLAAWVLVRLIWLLFYRPGRRIISTYEEED